MLTSPYTVLKITESASDDEISHAYKELAKRYHPDKNNGNSEHMVELNEAYLLIGNTKSRQEYDKKRMFSNAFGMWSNIFGKSEVAANFKNPPLKEKNKSITGENIKINIFLTEEQIKCGIQNYNIIYSKKNICNICSGTGSKTYIKCSQCGGNGKTRTIVKDTDCSLIDKILICNKCNGKGKIIKTCCSACNGNGYILRPKSLNINIDPFKKEIILIGQGNCGFYNGENGNLIIKIKKKKKQNNT